MINYSALSWDELIRRVSNWFDHPKAILEALKRLKENQSSGKKYVAFITQTGTNTPIVEVVENTLGGSINWIYSDIGDYLLQSNNLFSGKVGGFIQDTNVNFTRIQKIDNNTVNVTTMASGNGQVQDGLLTKALIEIRVY